MNNGLPVTMNLFSVIKDINAIKWDEHSALGRQNARIFDIFHDDSGQRIALVPTKLTNHRRQSND
ncbi:hypothetical protein PCO86_12755 [Pectobacteriaceae bacterium CE70]|nr:hypothetical protein PCO87_10295 [Pectobacteriaceae bacterium C52]WJV65202.1 hypothetical protein PCO86_12755 [Pectobacteriaceae bacterium CE70]WJY09216.1 hypothetical protein PCO80_12630 [Pectobacteriaceae bacterium C80]